MPESPANSKQEGAQTWVHSQDNAVLKVLEAQSLKPPWGYLGQVRKECNFITTVTILKMRVLVE